MNKKRLYESIMSKVSRIVKRELTEASFYNTNKLRTKLGYDFDDVAGDAYALVYITKRRDGLHKIEYRVFPSINPAKKFAVDSAIERNAMSGSKLSDLDIMESLDGGFVNVAGRHYVLVKIDSNECADAPKNGSYKGIVFGYWEVKNNEFYTDSVQTTMISRISVPKFIRKAINIAIGAHRR